MQYRGSEPQQTQRRSWGLEINDLTLNKWRKDLENLLWVSVCRLSGNHSLGAFKQPGPLQGSITEMVQKWRPTWQQRSEQQKRWLWEEANNKKQQQNRKITLSQEEPEQKGSFKNSSRKLWVNGIAKAQRSGLIPLFRWGFSDIMVRFCLPPWATAPVKPRDSPGWCSMASVKGLTGSTNMSHANSIWPYPALSTERDRGYGYGYQVMNTNQYATCLSANSINIKS